MMTVKFIIIQKYKAYLRCIRIKTIAPNLCLGPSVKSSGFNQQYRSRMIYLYIASIAVTRNTHYV